MHLNSSAGISQDSVDPIENSSLTEVTDQHPAETAERILLKLIPDQKTLLGSPATVIDLRNTFAKTELAKEDGPLKIEVKRFEKDVADAKLEGGLLTLTWGEKTDKTREVMIRATGKSGRYIDTKFYVKLWKPDYWKLIFTVLGGLGIFLLGMKNMSEGVQAVAGDGLRKVIRFVTGNRFKATAVGALVTTLVQSSSITTVMVVGFVNSGFMTLTQAIGVIMGANIGTTITGVILALKIGKYGLPIAGAAAFVYLFARRDRVRFLALSIMGLGLIFLGLELMKDGFAVVKELPAFEAWFEKFDAHTYGGVLMCVLVGAVLTCIVQSSSATLGITIGLAQIGVIQFETAAALVLGQNIGTTITAWLASLGTTTNAKRAAYFHIAFNFIGSTWAILLFPWYIMLIKYIMTGETDGDVAAKVTAAIAVTHIVFNVVNTIVFLPTVDIWANVLQRFVPEKEKEEHHLTSLDVRMLESPGIAIEQSRAEVLRMARRCQEMMDGLGRILASDEINKRELKDLFQKEDELDTMQHEVISFLADLMSANITHELVDKARRQLRMADEYESISDCIASVLKSHRGLARAELKMPESQAQEVQLLQKQVQEFLVKVTNGYRNGTDIFDTSISEGELISKHAKKLVKQLTSQDPSAALSPQIMVAYNRQIVALRRVRDHLVNIAEALAGEK